MKIELYGQATKELKRLSKKNPNPARRICAKLKELSRDISIGCPLKGPLKGSYGIRIGDYRVIYDIIEKDNVILVWKIQHRREVYK